jgi:hypothetical protein
MDNISWVALKFSNLITHFIGGCEIIKKNAVLSNFSAEA